jgi:hypothetical protein
VKNDKLQQAVRQEDCADISRKTLAAGGQAAAGEKNETGKLQIADDIGEDVPDAGTEQDQDDNDHECDQNENQGILNQSLPVVPW